MQYGENHIRSRALLLLLSANAMRMMTGGTRAMAHRISAAVMTAPRWRYSAKHLHDKYRWAYTNKLNFSLVIHSLRVLPTLDAALDRAHIELQQKSLLIHF